MSWLSETSWVAFIAVGRALGKLPPLLAQNNKQRKNRTRTDKRTRAIKKLKVHVEKYREDNKKRKEKFLLEEMQKVRNDSRNDYEDWCE